MAKKREGKEKEDGPEIPEEEQRRATLAALFKAAEKNFGKGTLISADEHKYKRLPRIPTGILPLDYALGGGLPVGRISMFYGHKGTGKTTQLLRSVGNAQKYCSHCWNIILTTESGKKTCSPDCERTRRVVTAWLDVEGVWDHEWASKFLTVDENLILSQPSTAEQTIDLGHAALRSEVDIIVIDSIAFMEPKTEEEKSAAEFTVGAQARLMGTGIRKFVSTTNDLGKTTGRRPTIFLTNQIRMKVGVMFGNPETISGGLAAGFSTSVEVKTSAGKYEMDEVSGKPLNVLNKAKIEKNKTSPAHMEAEWKMALMKTDYKNVGDVMDEDFAFSMGEKTGLISVAPQKVEWDGKLFRGGQLLQKHWMENREDYDKFKSQLMPVLLAV